jgi:hypothetical protein
MMHPRLPYLPNVLLTANALLVLSVASAAAGPNGVSVVGGAATIHIGVNESVRLNQPSSSSVGLHRVTGGLGPSKTMGTLTANGRYNFNVPGRPDASIVNQGRITATSGGFAALVAPGGRNSGTITSTLGTVARASGNSFTLDMYGDKLITLAVGNEVAAKVRDVATGQPLKSLVTNDGRIRANGGRVDLPAAAARTVIDSVINTSGVIKANSIGHRNGMIVLGAATGATKPAGAPAQTVKISGMLSRKGTLRAAPSW